MTIQRSPWDVPVVMRDGVRLSADIYLPVTGIDGGPYPTVLIRTPYNKQLAGYVEAARRLAEAGYACVLQDVRGRHDSDGSFVSFRNEGPDGYDTVEWIAGQPWSNGRVGTMGGSYGGWCQWALAREKPPHLVTMVSSAGAGNWMREIPYNNGVLSLVMLGWLNLVTGRVQQDPDLVGDWPGVFRHLPVREMDSRLGHPDPTWQEWLDHPLLDDYWNEIRLDDSFAEIAIPTLHITGWYDDDQPGALYFYGGMTQKSPAAAEQRLVIGAWDHAGTRMPKRRLGGVDFGDAAVVDILDLHRQWFDHWLKGEAAMPVESPTRIFLTGANEWHAAPAWPPPARITSWYLHSGGRANTLVGDGRLSAAPPAGDQPQDSFVYDPADPVPSVMAENFYSPEAPDLPLDYRFKHRRDDVLVYTSEPVDTELILVGVPTVHLFASSDGPDTDWFVALHDVAETGVSVMLAGGLLRARYRDGLDHEALLEPDQVYEFVIDTSALGHVLRAGHRLRLSVTSSEFPTWDRNPNTGAPIADATVIRVATNRVSHTSGRPSRIDLPLIDAAVLTRAVHP